MSPRLGRLMMLIPGFGSKGETFSPYRRYVRLDGKVEINLNRTKGHTKGYNGGVWSLYIFQR